jgi:hypothetical protein
LGPQSNKTVWMPAVLRLDKQVGFMCVGNFGTGSEPTRRDSLNH